MANFANAAEANAAEAADAHQAAGHQQALLVQILHNSPVAVALTRASDGVIVDVNAEWTRLTGYARNEALGRTTVDLGFWADSGDRSALAQSGL